MPSRYGPGVLPEPNLSFASALSGLAKGFEYGQQMRERKRQREREDVKQREHEEDRARMTREREAADLARPGAVSLGTYLDRPGVEADLAPSTLREMGNAAVPEMGALDFTPKAGARYFQTATGPVVDREAAMQESLAPYLTRLEAGARFRSGYPTASQAATLQRADLATKKAATQAQSLAQNAARLRSEYPELDALGLDDAETVRIGATWQKRLHPVAPRPRRSTTTPTDRSLAALQREKQQAQSRLQSLENSPAASPDDREHQTWIEQRRIAQAAFDSAAARVQRALRPPGRTAGREPLPSLPPFPPD